MDESKITLLAAVQPGEVWQLKDGRVGIYNPTIAGASGDRALFTTSGKFTFTKATGFVGLDGGRAYWDHSANAVTYKKVNDRDYYLGRLVGDSATGDTTCVVDINVDPCYDIDLNKDPFLSTIVGTAAAGGFGYPVRLGGASILELTATNEAQKVDLISRDGFAVGANAIVEGAFLILSDGSNATQDFNIGIANGTHASDADAITESCFIHIDGNSTNINAESDDGTTEVAATDTTADYTEGSAVAQRVEFWMDLRDPADIQIYVNGSLVLGSTVFKLDAATGPLFLLAHLEKSSSTDTYKVAVDWLRVRFSEQNAS
jgi:hypothetical protein